MVIKDKKVSNGAKKIGFNFYLRAPFKLHSRYSSWAGGRIDCHPGKLVDSEDDNGNNGVDDERVTVCKQR